MTSPKPGSDEARKMGCVCPKWQGGRKRPIVHVSAACELHRIPALDALLKAVGATGGGT